MSVARPCNCKPLLLSVEAIIGAGKSTLLEALDAREDIVVVREPVDLWTQQRGNETLLSRYYGDQKSNAFMFETYAMMSRVQALQDAMSLVRPDTRAVVMERSWLSSRYCFGENSKTLGHLDDLEFSLYDDLFTWGRSSWPELDGAIFIDVSVPVAQGRVAIRGRTAESAIPCDYQTALVERHRAWLQGEGSASFHGAVLTLDGNMDKSNGALDVMMAQTMDFVDELFAQRAKMILRENCSPKKENLCDAPEFTSTAGYQTPVKMKGPAPAFRLPGSTCK
eukprot:CAMPEP_0197651988 /NCGR_PEP_ID=MMETSP1338-20131121/34177_1 /TAXON_ID=43686 ORGANISM="Pelagodinium beii, Strain RCC1491" /NCGR_SAMPLE_ID=MMETSP1338 /ASSEMBLY_ACC=CAM_ASM_000754 /LENGTH=279 /DNA_ID=CAMNT_0043226767 /DNA_START=30 /DNA_END=869 /DNA_ORIENTATION=+